MTVGFFMRFVFLLVILGAQRRGSQELFLRHCGARICRSVSDVQILHPQSILVVDCG